LQSHLTKSLEIPAEGEQVRLQYKERHSLCSTSHSEIQNPSPSPSSERICRGFRTLK
ncbi:hypothetical protein NDU88_005752, partial [Pleurodeles waltl]